jgi:hypothetical protein
MHQHSLKGRVSSRQLEGLGVSFNFHVMGWVFPACKAGPFHPPQVGAYVPPADGTFSKILVPTVDIVRCKGRRLLGKQQLSRCVQHTVNGGVVGCLPAMHACACSDNTPLHHPTCQVYVATQDSCRRWSALSFCRR